MANRVKAGSDLEQSKTTTVPAFSIEMIAPVDAARILKRNEGNRTLSERNVQFLLSEMKRGNWKTSGHTIKLSRDGRLLDGQHTLHALIKYGRPLQLCVARGLDDDIFEVLDTGKVRTSADVLQISGFRNANALSGVVRSIKSFQAGAVASNGGKSRVAVSNSHIRAFVESNPSIHELVVYSQTVSKRFKGLPPAQIGMLYWILSHRHQEKADVFFEKYSTGIDLSEKSPIRILRERLMKDMISKSKLRTRDKMALFIKAWNHFCQNQYVTSLALAANYEFPKPL